MPSQRTIDEYEDKIARGVARDYSIATKDVPAEIASRIAAAQRSKPEPVDVKTLATRDTRTEYWKPPFPSLGSDVLATLRELKKG